MQVKVIQKEASAQKIYPLHNLKKKKTYYLLLYSS